MPLESDVGSRKAVFGLRASIAYNDPVGSWTGRSLSASFLETAGMRGEESPNSAEQCAG